ncbi:MAG TPA: MBG domain-containing protein, partial [Urbifossiella sp.]|nr:MBG domain-containing protein [Urbifossiella sp.]
YYSDYPTETPTYGNYVVVSEYRDGTGIKTLYAHLKEVAPEFLTASTKNPIAVYQGQTLGSLGNTGTSTDHHLHYEVKYDNAPALYSGAADALLHSHPTYFKGFMDASNKLVVSQHPDQLASRLFSFALPYQPRFAPVVMARPNDDLQFQLKGYDWNEEIFLRLRNETGGSVPVNVVGGGSNPFFTGGWDFDGLDNNAGDGRDDPSRPNDAGQDDGRQAPTEITIRVPSTPGYYLLEGLERNPRYLTGIDNTSNSDVYALTQATGVWPSQAIGEPNAAYSMPVILLITADAPAHGFRSQIATMRSSSIPPTIYTVDTDRVLLVPGSHTTDDTITLEKSGTQYVLTVNGTVSSFQDSDFNAVFVAPGGGNNVVDLRDVAASKRVTVIGGDGIDIILGGPGNDVLVGGAGADWIEGGGGNDWVFGNDGSDTLFSHTSARRSLFSNEHTTRDNLFGEADTDQLFSRRGDVVYGGSTDDTFYGRQGERGLNTYVAWGANQIPVGIGDTILLVGDEVGNQFTIKPPQAGVRLVDMDGFTFPLTDAAFRRYVRMLALPGGGPDTVDLRNSPIPARVFAVGGNDTVYGTAQGDTISGGIGDDVLYGERGNDRIGGKAGNDTIRGGANDDELYGDAGEDDIDGGTEKDYIDGRLDGADDHAADRLTGNGQSTIILGVSDVNLRPGPDLQVIQPGQTAPANRPVVIDSYLVASAGEALPSRAAPVESESRAAVQISSFTVTPSLVPRGDSALFTLRTTGTGTSARLTLVHDRNNNGVYDAPDAIIARYRPAAGGLRGQIGTENFMPGVVKVLPVLDFSDGSVVVGPAIPFTVQDQLAALLPPGIAVMPDDVLSLIPHRNGDVTVVGNVLAGRGQIDVWEITPRATGAFRFWTTGSTDTVVALYNAAGQRIGDPDDDSGPGVNGEILATLAADTTYYFAVACKTPDGGGYDLRVTGVNQTVAATIDTPPGAFTGSATGTITVTHRLDYLQLVAPAGATLLDVAIETDPSLAVWVRVADSNSTVIGFAQPGRAGLDQVLTRLPVQGGRTYYVTIFGLYGTAGDYTAAADFYPDEVGLPLTTTIPLLGEYEQLIVGADGDVTLGGQAIDTPGQFRTYIISPTTSGEFVIQTTGSTDTMLAVYTGSGSQRLGWSDNDGGGGNARVTLDLTGGQDYIVKIRGAGTATGPFAVRVNGADQFRRPITIAGRSYLGDDVASVAGNARQMYFSAVAPPAATTLNMSLTALSGSTFDGWFSIQDEAGIRTVVNTVGINTVDSIANFPVQGGKTYLFTVFGWNETTGSARLGLDFNPNVSGGGEIPLATTTFDTQRNPHVAVAPDGRAVAVWIGYKPNGASGDYEVYGQRFDARGEAVGPEFLVNVDDTQDQEFATVAVDASGNFVVAWRTNGVVSARVYDAAGTPTGPEFLAGISAQQGLAVAKQPGGSFLLVGGQSTQLVGRLFNPSGSPAGAAFVIDPNHANNVSVAADGQGRYVLAWTRTQGASVAVYAARYSAAGALVTPLFPVAPALATSQFESSVDAAASGAFVVAFRSFDGGPTGNDVYFQRFAADASPLGVLTRPHEFTTGTQDVPSVAMKDNTEVVVAWQSPNPQGGTGTEVYARHYDAAGNPADPQETRINEYTPNDQSRPRIATNGQQRFGLVWQSYMPAGSVDDVVGLFMDFATPTPRPVLRVTESAGTPDDAALPFGSYLQNAPNPTQVVRVSNLGTTNLTGTAALAGGGAFALIGPATFDLAPGQFQDYTVVLSTAARGSFTSTLTITSNSAVGTVPVAVTATVVPPPDANEPNESAPAATNLGVVSVLSRTNLTLHRDQDEDWYVFTVARPSVLTVFTSFSHSEGDLDILLLDQHFGVLAAAASQVDQESMSVAVPGGQLLYLKAVAVGAAADVYDLHIQEITAPTADIRDVGPDPRASGVGTILFDFSEPVTGFDVSDLVLTRNGTAVALTGATLTTTGNMTWTVGNVSGLTALDGVYELSLTGTGSGIADSAGNPFTDTVTDTWVMDTTTTTAVSAPAITYGAAGAVTVTVGSTLGTPDGTIQLIVDGTSTYTGTLSAGAHTFAVGVLGAGTHTLSANYLGSATWQPSTTAGSLLVNRAALTLAADAQSKVYGAALPTLTFTTSGLVNGDTPATALAGAPTTTATAASGVGAYPVTIGTLAAANYAVTFTDSTLTVTAASLAATPTSGQTKVYGANLPVLAYTTAGLVNGDTPAAVLSGLLGSTATAASVVGTYAITGGTLAANANYTLTITPGVTLAVTPAPLTVAADPKSKVYGAALPALTFTTSGLVNGDTAASALTGALATTAIAASGVGAYPITWGTLAAANYTLSITDSSLSVTPAALTVVADAKSKVYGAVVPTLTFTTSGFVNGDTPASALTGAPATTATAASGVGGYSITTGTLAAPNYAVTFTDNTLTVTPAALTVAADALSKVYGAALPTLTFTTSGFVNGDTAASALTGALATTATAASGVGAYPVTIGTLAAA